MRGRSVASRAAPEPSRPAPEPTRPAPEPSRSRPPSWGMSPSSGVVRQQPGRPAPQPRTPAPQPRTPCAPTPNALRPNPERPAPQPRTPCAPTPNALRPNPERPAPQPRTPAGRPRRVCAQRLAVPSAIRYPGRPRRAIRATTSGAFAPQRRGRFAPQPRVRLALRPPAQAAVRRFAGNAAQSADWPPTASAVERAVEREVAQAGSRRAAVRRASGALGGYRTLMICRTAGSSRMMNSAGKIRNTRGKSILIGAFCARSSAICRRRLRMSTARLRIT